jgi:hypothetical protein
VNEAEFADSGGGGEGTGQNGNLNGGHRATYAVVNGYSLGPSAHVDDASRVLDDDYGADKPAVLVPDLSPLVVTDNTSLSQLHFMFVMLMPTHAYVLSDGRLQGVVKRSDLVVTGAILASNVPPPR